MKKKKKYKSFGHFVLEDTEVVMPFLMTLSLWSGLIIISLLILLMIRLRFWPFVALFIFMDFLAIKKLYRHYKLGGSKYWKGKSANEMVWNKEGK